MDGEVTVKFEDKEEYQLDQLKKFKEALAHMEEMDKKIEPIFTSGATYSSIVAQPPLTVPTKKKKTKKAYGYVVPPPPQAPKSTGVVPLTKEEFNAMDPKAKWDSIVGLRGPDLKHSDNLKWFTSSVIRHKLSAVMRVGGMVNTTIPFVVLPTTPTDVGEFSATHFCGHILEAAQWLNIPILYVSNKVWTKILDESVNRYKIIAAIYKETQDPEARQWLEDVAKGMGMDLTVYNKEAYL